MNLELSANTMTYTIFGLIALLVAMVFIMAIMYYKYVLRKRWDARASCIENGLDSITAGVEKELSEITLEAVPSESISKKLVKLIQQQEEDITEHPITLEPLPEDIHDLFNPKLQPRNGVLVQFSERDLLSFPKTALSGNDMIREIKEFQDTKDVKVEDDDVPLDIVRSNSCKRVGRSVVKYPNSSRENSCERGVSSRSRQASRRRQPSRARSDFDDRHSKFQHPKYRGNKEFEEYYLEYLVPTISAVVQQTLAQSLNPKNNYVDQWIHNNEGSIDGLQTPSLKSF